MMYSSLVGHNLNLRQYTSIPTMHFYIFILIYVFSCPVFIYLLMPYIFLFTKNVCIILSELTLILIETIVDNCLVINWIILL